MNVEITKQEIEILIACIKMASREGFYEFDDSMTYEEQINILKSAMVKLGISSHEADNIVDYC